MSADHCRRVGPSLLPGLILSGGGACQTGWSVIRPVTIHVCNHAVATSGRTNRLHPQVSLSADMPAETGRTGRDVGVDLEIEGDGKEVGVEDEEGSRGERRPES